MASSVCGPANSTIGIIFQHNIAITLHGQDRAERGRNEDGIGGGREGSGGEEGIAERVGGLGGAVGEDLVLRTIWETVGIIVHGSTLGICYKNN